MVKAFDIKDNLKGVAKDGKNIILACFLIIFLLATWKYVKDGETYEFQTPTTENFIDLSGSVVSQEIIIDELADWKDRSYAVYFHLSAGADVKETIHLELSQNGEVVESADVNVGWLSEGFNALKWLDFSNLDAGTYRLSISGKLSQPLYVELCDNTYNIPNCYVNGEDTGATLVQRYHYNYSNTPYKIGIALFIALIAICVVTFWLCCTKKEDAAWFLRISLIATYIILAYEYDSTLFFQPTGYEAITNFMHNSINQSWWNCLHIADAGYLPLVQRLIAIFIYNFLNITPYVGAFLMQMSAFVLTGIILSFFAKKQFSDVLDIRSRWILSVILMTFVLSNEESGSSGYEASFFINFMVFGVYIFFLYFLVESGKWSKMEFFVICIWTFLQCASKGVSVTLLPFCIVCFILFYRNYSKRDKILLASCAAGALLQFCYYFGYGVHLLDWVDQTNSAGGEFYYLKLFLGILVDTPNWLLSPFSNMVTLLNGIAVPIIIGFWVLIICLFTRTIILKVYHKENLERESCAFFMMILYIMAQSVFLRITITGVERDDILNDNFWIFHNLFPDRHSMTIVLAVATAFIAVLHVVEKRQNNKNNLLMLVAILLLVCIVNPRMQLKGIGNDDYKKSSVFFAGNNSEVSLLKGIQDIECRIVPMIYNRWVGWTYNKNAVAYCFGSDEFKWGLGVTASEEPQKGELSLGNYENVDTSVPIWQVFVNKNCLVNTDEYAVILRDGKGNVLLKQEQDNTKYQRIASFTFDKGVGNVSSIQIVDGNGDSVWLDNTMYIVTKSGENLIK